MMKLRLLAILTSLALSACAGAAGNEADNASAANAAAPNTSASNTATAQLPDADPAMWVVRDEDTTIYLFGTFHLLDGKADWFNDEIRVAFDQAQELVTEIDMRGGTQQMAIDMQPLIMQYAIDPQRRKLSDVLTPEQNRILNEALASMGAPPGAFDMFEPWFASMTLSAVVAQRLGMTGDHGAETVLLRAAEGRNMTLGAVETLESQIRIFDGMPREAQIAQLKESIDNLDKMGSVLARMLEVWNSGDAEGMERIMNEGMRENSALRRALLENRNRAWAEWIDERMDRPGVVFMAVGAGHLVGPDSVQVFLRQRNIASERVPALTQ